MPSKDQEFLNKLKTLLDEYEMSIGFSCGPSSDTHGLYDEKICIDNSDNMRIFETEGWWMCSSDLKSKGKV